MVRQITEGLAVCFVPQSQKITAKMDVFYNPLMKENRDITLLFLNAFFDRPFSAASLMAGTGVREVRMLKEVPFLSFLAINDGNPHAVALIQKNLMNNALGDHRYLLSHQEASLFLLNGQSWDYIDVDPFGSPNPFLDAAIRKCKNGGVLGITATDTAALAGTYPKATLRKYWARPLLNYLMHEVGLRILLRKIQLLAAQYQKAAVPVFSYFSRHYYRVFVQLSGSKRAVDSLLEQHCSAFYCYSCCAISTPAMIACRCPGKIEIGPLWTGQLWDPVIAQKIASGQNNSFLTIIAQEALVPVVGFFDLHAFAKQKKCTSLPKTGDAFTFFQNRGYLCARTHFTSYGLRTTAPYSLLEDLFTRSCV